MKVIEAFAHILTDEGVDAVGVTAILESYVLSSRRWVKIATARSVAKGLWQAKVSQLQPGAFYAPILRLTEPGTPAPRVLAQAGNLSYNASKQILSVDFGLVERLEETAYPLTASNALFRRSKYTVAGQPKRAKISSAMLIRNVAMLSPGITSSAVRPGLAVNVGATNTAAAAETPVTRSPVLDTFDSEILKFKAKEAKLQLQISQKDQQLSVRNVELNTVKSRVTELEANLSKAVESETNLKKENAAFVAEAKRKAPIQSIAANIGAEVDAANRKLLSEKRPYRFGRIELDLRGTVSTDGQSMALANLVDLEKLGGGTSLPGLKMELLSEREQSEVSTSVEVPDVTGLTETAVRRLLQAVGLRLESVSKSVEPGAKIPIGQSIQQSPKAGAELSRNMAVLVVFAAPKANLEK